MLIFFLGVLLGVLFGGTLCVAYLRQEVAASINPKLRRVELQLETIESQLNLAIITRYAELSARSADSTPRQQQELNNHQHALFEWPRQKRKLAGAVRSQPRRCHGQASQPPFRGIPVRALRPPVGVLAASAKRPMTPLVGPNRHSAKSRRCGPCPQAAPAGSMGL